MPFDRRPFVQALSALCLASIAACGGGGGGAPPEVDVSGVWFGSYATADGGSGPVILDLTQDGAQLTGGLEVLGDAVADGNVGVWISGSVSGHRATIAVNDSPDRVEATESSGALSGTISSGGLTATWNATRVETHTLSFAASRPAGVQSPQLLAFQGGALWVLDWYDGALDRTDDAGGVVETIPPGVDQKCEGGFDGCGDRLVCSDAYGGIDLFDAGTHELTHVSAAGVHTQGITCGADQESMWAVTGTSTTPNVQQLDMQGSPLAGPFFVPGILNEIAFDGTDLWVLEFFPRILVRVSATTGQILAAYRMPAAMEISQRVDGLTWDGTALWTLLTTHGESSSTTVAVKLAVSN
jgi:hypothetical protein